MGFFDLPPRTLTLVAFILGFLMIDDLSAPEQNSLGNFLILIGQVLETNAGQQAVVAARESNQRLSDVEEKLKRYDAYFGR